MNVNELWLTINGSCKWSDIHNMPQYGIRVEYRRTELAFIRFIYVESLGTKINWWWQSERCATAEHGHTCNWADIMPDALVKALELE